MDESEMTELSLEEHTDGALKEQEGRGGRVGRACDFGSIGCGFAARTRKLIRHHVAAFEQSCDHWRSAHAPWYFCGACSRTLT